MTDQALPAARAEVRTAPRPFETDTHQSFLAWRRFLWLKAATILVLVSVALYAWHRPIPAANGGTWLGYGLGTIAALLIFWLTWFGWRKRSYSRAGRVQAYLSAHVYLGLSLIVVATLHTGFQFGWNVHTLAYVLMLLVIASGVFGIIAYIRYPTLMTENRRGMSTQQFMSRIATLDGEARQVALSLSDEIAQVVARASQNTRVGGSVLRQLSGRDPNCATTAALGEVQDLVRRLPPSQSANGRALLVLLSQKVEFLRRLRRDIQYKAIMDIWLYVHVPVTFALLAALVAHIISVFFYF
jgi:uncharacterized membrane protein SirB2